ncbi:hypothetical protein [Megasphaera stantonii]|uniref:Uncharacterized protein n=1 Tax=Megasphaera stantonii TaxID=2144175 RepID=A0A346B185_9FIRM|nr:hypothetical protein [Megasphaera stantonii]AXL21878.1 hypothetical protein DKB62_10050 [Megasphaera stantonii]
MAKADYLIKFDADGNSGETHDAAFMSETDIAKYKEQGFIEVSTADYMNLLGNNADNQPYIRQNDGTYIPKPPYVPTPEEAQAAKLSALDNEYAAKLDENKSSIIVAATVDQDEEYADQLRQERQALQAEYVQKRSEL